LFLDGGNVSPRPEDLETVPDLGGFAAANDLAPDQGAFWMVQWRRRSAMVRVTVLYPNESAKRFDHDYYASKHLPMVMERLKGSGMLRYEVDKGLAGGGPGAPAPFVAACHLYFNAAADFQKGIAAHGTEIMGDIPNYTDISPQIQISEIVVG
jgi:uncharacterized protein (TIGR02118 family)